MKGAIDYQTKVWGTVVPQDSPFSLAGLRFHYFLPHIRYRKGCVLEVGCGAGGNLAGLHRYAPHLELYGVDVGEKAIVSGKFLFPFIQFTCAPAEKLPYPDDFFDCVCFFDVLEHVLDPLDCIREAVRVLKPGGVFHAYVPCEGELLTLHGIFHRFGVHLKKDIAGHIQNLTKRELISHCETSGLRVYECLWSCHALNQIGDIGYYSYLTLSKKRFETSLEETLHTNNRSSFSFLLRFFVGFVSSIWYWESRLFWFLPGAGVHITALKE